MRVCGYVSVRVCGCAGVCASLPPAPARPPVRSGRRPLAASPPPPPSLQPSAPSPSPPPAPVSAPPAERGGGQNGGQNEGPDGGQNEGPKEGEYERTLNGLGEGAQWARQGPHGPGCSAGLLIGHIWSTYWSHLTSISHTCACRRDCWLACLASSAALRAASASLRIAASRASHSARTAAAWG
eukprot:1070157-Prorocentrum_minimum.AAC.1